MWLFGPQPNVTISIIILIEFSMKQKLSLIPLECNPKPDKPIFHKNLDIFFSMYPYTHVGNTLLVNNAPYKNMFNEPYNAIFLEFSFDGLRGEDIYLLGHVLFYLEFLHLSKYGVSTYAQHDPFCRIICINRNNLG